jgi:hypothetical protein
MCKEGRRTLIDLGRALKEGDFFRKVSKFEYNFA